MSDGSSLRRDLCSFGLTILIFLLLGLFLNLLSKQTKELSQQHQTSLIETEWAPPRKSLLGLKASSPSPQKAIRTKRSQNKQETMAPSISDEPLVNQVEKQPDLPSYSLQLVYTPEIKLPDYLEDLLTLDDTLLEFELTLGSSVKTLKVIRSSGIPEVDFFCQQFILKRWIFKPAMWQGEVIETKKRIRIQIRPD